MLLLAEGLFRLDVVPAGDTLRVVVRNLSGGALELEGGDEPVAALQLGDAARYAPAQSGLSFTVGGREVRVTLGTLTFPGTGTVRITGQAIVESVG